MNDTHGWHYDSMEPSSSSGATNVTKRHDRRFERIPPEANNLDSTSILTLREAYSRYVAIVEDREA